MLRVILIVIGLGCVVIFFGVQEYLVSAGTTTTPETFDLRSLEMNTPFKNNHAKISEFWALYPEAIFEYETSQYADTEPVDTTKINYAYYPIISDEHEFLAQLRELVGQYGELENIPDEEFPGVGNFTVLVKTKQFATVGDIPSWFDFIDTGITGLFINKIKKLESDEINLLRDSFPNMDFGKVLILEEGRKPKSLLFAYGLIGLGALLIVSPLVVFIVYKQQQKAKQAEKPQTAG